MTKFALERRANGRTVRLGLFATAETAKAHAEREQPAGALVWIASPGGGAVARVRRTGYLVRPVACDPHLGVPA